MTHEIEVRSGSFTARLSDGALRDVRLLGHRALDGVYVSVRDRDWNTVPGVISDFHVAPRPGGFAASWYSRHLGSGIDFGWRGSIDAGQQAVDFRMEGEALAEFEANRIGICLLHPAELAGTAIEVITAGGITEAAFFPHRISPSPILTGAASLSYQVGPGALLKIGFLGGPLETEDHRNWTDPGWKSYTPPLSEPAPRRMRPGDRISQAVSLAGIATPAPRPRPSAGDTVELGIGREDGVMPALGMVMADAGEQESASLSRMRPAVVHVDLLENDDWRSRLQAAADLAARIGSTLCVALVGTDPRWLESCAQALSARTRPLAAVGVFGPAGGIAGPGSGRLVRRYLDHAQAGTPVGGGSRLHFAELNRAASLDPEWDFAAFAVTAQAHHRDDSSVMSTILGQGPAVRDAAAVTGGLPVIVGPVSMRPRGDPLRPASPRDPRDARECEPLGVAWLCAAVAAMHAADLITFLNPALDGTGLVSPFASHDMERVFASLAGMAGEPVSQVESDWRRIAALAVRRPRGTPVLILSNLTPDPVTVRLGRRTWPLRGYEAAIAGY